MDIVQSIAIGSVAAAFAMLTLRGSQAKFSATLAVGILGALLGLAIYVAMGRDGVIDLAVSEYLVSGCGAVSALFLWIVAQRLFIVPPSQTARATQAAQATQVAQDEEQSTILTVQG